MNAKVSVEVENKVKRWGRDERLVLKCDGLGVPISELHRSLSVENYHNEGTFAGRSRLIKHSITMEDRSLQKDGKLRVSRALVMGPL